MLHTKPIAENGYSDLVAMSVEAYEETLKPAKTDLAINKAENEFATSSVLLDARETLSFLRKKHFV